MQCPYYVHRALRVLLGLPADKVRVVATTTGGGFGGKEEYPSMIAGHAALLAWKSGHPVKMIYDRAEDMVATTKRHPSRTRIRAAVSRDGKLLALDIDLINDAVDFNALLDRAFEASGYRAKSAEFVRSNVGSRVKRGMGFATFMHGAGFTGSGEEYLASIVGIEADAAGHVRLLVANTEIG